jgi:diaminopimelate decarboxylase
LTAWNGVSIMADNLNNLALKINSKDHLCIGGCDCVDLARDFGTPLYVMDENIIRENMRKYKHTMDRHFGGSGLVVYASKALCNMAICRIAHQEGLGIDVVSGGELYTAKKSGFPMEKVYFHGNNKTPKELSEALDYGVGRIIVDNTFELEKLNELCTEKGKNIKISVRVKPGIDVHTHEYVRTGQVDSKFGVAIENGEIFEFIDMVKKFENIKLVGLHCHIGSQIFDLQPFEDTAKIMIELIVHIKEKYGITISELNLGGGFGIKYTEEDDPLEYSKFIETISNTITALCSQYNLEKPFIIIEPGRSIVAPAGITLYTIGSVKDIKNIRKYVSVDGGMCDNPRYALYKSKYTFLLANRARAQKTEMVTVAGKCCESGDLLGENVPLPKAQPGDIMAVLATGAYNYSMSMNYNRNGRPPMVLVKDGNARIIVKGEDYEDIIRNDVIPEDL